MKEIKLSNSELFIQVDDSDYERLIRHKWRQAKCYTTDYFNVRGSVNGKETYIGRFILGLEDSNLVVDHIDRNTLNNQRYNLRAISQGDNVRNAARVNYCFYSIKATRNSFAVQSVQAITNVKIHHGSYLTKEEALLVRDKLLLKDFGIHCKHFTYDIDYILNTPEPVRLTKGSSSIIKFKGIERPEARKFNRPSREDIHKAVWNAPAADLAKSIGCSDKAIEKWCKFYNIPKPPRGFWNKIKEFKLQGQTCPLI